MRDASEGPEHQVRRRHQVAAHLHQRGSKANITILREGQAQCLSDIPAWDLNWQNGYTLKTPFELAAGGKVRVTCHRDNSAGAQPRRPDASRPPPRS